MAEKYYLIIYIYVCVYVYIYACIQKYTRLHSFVGKHLGSFYILAIVNSVTMNIGVHISFQISTSVFFGYITDYEKST